jgi:hypothetical protein
VVTRSVEANSGSTNSYPVNCSLGCFRSWLAVIYGMAAEPFSLIASSDGAQGTSVQPDDPGFCAWIICVEEFQLDSTRTALNLLRRIVTSQDLYA